MTCKFPVKAETSAVLKKMGTRNEETCPRSKSTFPNWDGGGKREA